MNRIAQEAISKYVGKYHKDRLAILSLQRTPTILLCERSQKFRRFGQEPTLSVDLILPTKIKSFVQTFHGRLEKLEVLNRAQAKQQQTYVLNYCIKKPLKSYRTSQPLKLEQQKK